ncbi:Pseudaminic acid synthase [Rubripirellula amarantea]|uniref:Pseudaminic acid synthase n=1 Tax=Rubripirellula amarantea TaxID=2527999 RepID=A0A5C5WSV5_9BACT|nr:pseudaminic acid synthase [Rubripirellula amarantea]TWT53717.1 Pseudaminic acid synthase [Rubripirellula amarantea]
MTNNDVTIAGRLIGTAFEPFVIAEMSGNHNQSLDRALAIVDAAADAGAHAIKLQTYTADTMTLDVEGKGFTIDADDSLWKGRKLHDLYAEAHTPWDWHQAIFDRATQQGLIAFSSPFDDTAVDLLESLNTPAYKIASFEMTHLPLVRKVASTGKPLIISTGMATLGEIEQTVLTARQAGAKEIVLLKCTSTYPASPENTNLRTIPHLREAMDVQVGLSDHTMGVGASVAAVAFGATVIEKHFTLSRADGGVDSTFSLEPNELRQLVVETKRAWQAIGGVSYGPTGAQVDAIQYRRSIYLAENVDKGCRIDDRHIRVIRPGHGLAPKHFEELIGTTATRDLTKGEPAQWGMFAQLHPASSH